LAQDVNADLSKGGPVSEDLEKLKRRLPPLDYLQQQN